MKIIRIAFVIAYVLFQVSGDYRPCKKGQSDTGSPFRNGYNCLDQENLRTRYYSSRLVKRFADWKYGSNFAKPYPFSPPTWDRRYPQNGEYNYENIYRQYYIPGGKDRMKGIGPGLGGRKLSSRFQPRKQLEKPSDESKGSDATAEEPRMGRKKENEISTEERVSPEERTSKENGISQEEASKKGTLKENKTLGEGESTEEGSLMEGETSTGAVKENGISQKGASKEDEISKEGESMEEGSLTKDETSSEAGASTEEGISTEGASMNKGVSQKESLKEKEAFKKKELSKNGISKVKGKPTEGETSTEEGTSTEDYNAKQKYQKILMKMAKGTFDQIDEIENMARNILQQVDILMPTPGQNDTGSVFDQVGEWDIQEMIDNNTDTYNSASQ